MFGYSSYCGVLLHDTLKREAVYFFESFTPTYQPACVHSQEVNNMDLHRSKIPQISYLPLLIAHKTCSSN